MQYDVEVAWQINDFCNFDCIYCWLYNKDKRKSFVGLKDTQKVINGFNNKELTWLVHMSGGEPFFFPNFIKLCEELTKKHYISINTNLSHKDVFNFVEKINPEKVAFIHCSLHIQERKRLKQVEDFIKKYHILLNKGFYIFCSYLMYPKLVNRFGKDYTYFKSKGIILHPKVFWGNYYCGIFKIFDYSRMLRGIRHLYRIRHNLRKIYPNAYSDKQKELIKFYIDMANRDENIYTKQQCSIRRTVDLSLDKNWVDKLLSYNGKYCLAGKKFIRMDQNGELIRCIDEKHHYLGNMFVGEIKLFKEPIVCNGSKCSCPYVGQRYALQ